MTNKKNNDSFSTTHPKKQKMKKRKSLHKYANSPIICSYFAFCVSGLQQRQLSIF
ncbi:hypothetical protein Hdeb2414_s0003g00095781 [Helianthus debilis subsp. tardiflorus]